jgi:hypothetical protein
MSFLVIAPKGAASILFEVKKMVFFFKGFCQCVNFVSLMLFVLVVLQI